jgi:hypothetical protein
MYCKRCHSKIEKNIINCPVCGFNNSNDFEMGKTTEIDIAAINGYKEPPNKNKTNPKIIFSIAIILILSILCIKSFITDTKSYDMDKYTTTTTKEVVNTKEFKVGNLRFYYPEEFDVENNTIFLKDNHDINIVFNIIDEETYVDLLSNNELLDTELNDIEAETYANENNYGYLLDIKNTKYHIVINYTSDITEENQTQINKILKSILIK